MEAVGKDLFEEWMQRLMGRIDRLDGHSNVSAANTDSKAGASAARAITRSRTCWSSSAGTWKKLYWTAGKC